jgi:hypothetical protein
LERYQAINHHYLQKYERKLKQYHLLEELLQQNICSSNNDGLAAETLSASSPLRADPIIISMDANITTSSPPANNNIKSK